MSHALIDALRAHAGVSSDAALARLLDVGSPDISNYRTQPKIIGPAVIRRINEKTGMPVARIRELMADKSPRSTIGRPRRKQSEQVAAPESVTAPEPKARHVTVTRTAQWTSTVYRVL